MTKTFKPLLALAPLALLAACSGDDPAPPPPPAENGEEMLDVTNEAIDVPEAPPVTNAPMVTNDMVAEEPAPVAEDEQIRADADATGMTSRVDRDAGEAQSTSATNSAATTGVSEEK